MLCDPLRCTGCEACRSVCPVGCIEMREDAEGFSRPSIDENRCVACGACERVCPRLNEPARAGEVRTTYAVKAKDDEVRMRETSGGAFGAFAKVVLSRGGVVFGCAFDEHIVARHIEVDSVDNLPRLFGSKYVQSAMGDAYTRVKARLGEGKPVLFSGTGCQIAGLIAFLGGSDPLLTTAEVLCEGVPSPGLLRGYLDYCGEMLGSNVTRFRFRSKDVAPWGINMASEVETVNGVVYTPANIDAYHNAFLKKHTLRPSCYGCPYTGKTRMADLTLFDYWGLEYGRADFCDYKGVSGVLVNSDQGAALFKRAKPDLICIETDFSLAASGNPILLRPSPRPALRDVAYASGCGASVFKTNPAFRATLADRVFAAAPNALKLLLKRVNRLIKRIRG